MGSGWLHQDVGRPSFAEAVVSETLGHNQRPERIHDAVDWERLGEIVGGPAIRRC